MKVGEDQFAHLAEAAIEAAASDGLLFVWDVVCAQVCLQFATQRNTTVSSRTA